MIRYLSPGIRITATSEVGEMTGKLNASLNTQSSETPKPKSRTSATGKQRATLIVARLQPWAWLVTISIYVASQCELDMVSLGRTTLRVKSKKKR
jgi:hypothetical protein